MRASVLLAAGFLLFTQQTSAPARTRQQVEAWTSTHQRAIVAELAALLEIPNVAADRPNILRNIEFLEAAFAKRGFTTRRLETTGNPLFFASRETPGATRTTLIYAHVDGQPVDPAAWKQESPFAPVMRTGRLDGGGAPVADWRTRDRFEDDFRLFARSASDDKSPIIATLAALDALAASGIQPSTHLKASSTPKRKTARRAWCRR